MRSFLGGDHFGRCDSIWSLSLFLLNGGLHHPKGKQFGTLYYIAEDRYLIEATSKQLDWVTRQSLTVRGCGSYEGRTDGKERHGARS